MDNKELAKRLRSKIRTLEICADDDWDEDYGTHCFSAIAAYKTVLQWLGEDTTVWRWRSMGEDDKFLALLKSRVKQSDEELKLFNKPGYGSDAEREYEQGWNAALTWCLNRYKDTAERMCLP